jgi:transcriptional regulator with XRE-family HTH domain
MNRALFSERIRMLRGSRGQQEAADLVGVPKNRWSTWELGKHDPKLQDLISICKAFSTSSDWVLGLSNDRGLNAVQQLGMKSHISKLKKSAQNVSNKADELLSSINELEVAL